MIALRWRLLPLASSTFVLGAIAAASPAAAGSFKVNPVNLSIPADRSATSLSLTNTDGQPVSVRVLTYTWTQPDGRDLYVDTNQVIVSPPIFTLAPGQTQLVRVGLKQRRSGEFYRVIFEEIPRAGTATSAIQVALRLNLPLFVEAAKGKPDLRWQAWRDRSGTLSLDARNLGNRHQKVLQIDLGCEAGGDCIRSKEMGDVLPQGSKQWGLGRHPEIGAGSTISLKIRTPTGDVQTQVVVQER